MAQKDDRKMTSEKLTQLCREFEQQAVSSPAEWVSFLTIASNLSAYQPSDQILIYGQRPTATAVTTYDYWMTKVKRAVKKNATGIAIFPPKSSQRRSIRYVFDVSDTRDGYYDVSSGRYVRADNDRMFLPSIIRRQDEEMILDVLRNNPNVNVSLQDGISIENAVREISRQRVEADLDRYVRTILHNAPKESPFLSLGTERQTAIIRDLLTASATYMIGHKVGIDSVLDGMEHAFDQVGIFSYNGAVIWLVTCLSHICTPVQNAIRNHLHELQREGRYDIKAAQEEKRTTSAVFSEVANEHIDNGQGRISSGGGLQDPEHRADGEDTGRDVRPEMAEIHGGEPRAAGNVPADAGNSGRDSGEGAERDGGQGDAVGAVIPDEAPADPSDTGHGSESQAEGRDTRDGGRRNPAADGIQAEGRVGTDLPHDTASDTERDTEEDIEENIPAEAEQTESIKRAVREETIPAAFLVSDSQINDILRTGTGFDDNRIRLLLGELSYIKEPATLAKILKDDFEISEGASRAKGYVIDSEYISVLMDNEGVFFSKGTRSDERKVPFTWEEISEKIISLYRSKSFVKEEYATGSEEIYLEEVAKRIVLYFWNRRNHEEYEKYRSLVFHDGSGRDAGFTQELENVKELMKGESLSDLRVVFESARGNGAENILTHLDAISTGAQHIEQANEHEPMTESFIPEDEAIRRAVMYAAPGSKDTRFEIQMIFENGMNGVPEKIKYLKSRCNNSGMGSITEQLTGHSNGITVSQWGISSDISYKDIAAVIDTQIKDGVFLPDEWKEEYQTFKENLSLAGITYRVRTADGTVAEGIQLDDMIRLIKEDPLRSADAVIRGRNGITIPYEIIRAGILCPEDLYRPIQISKIGSGRETDERENERDFALMREVMREHIPQIVEQLPGMRIIPTTSSPFHSSVRVNIISSDNAAFHEQGWSISRPDTEAVLPGEINFDVFARYVEEISGRYENTKAAVYPSSVTFDIIASSQSVQDTLVKEGAYRHTVYFSRGMNRVHLRSMITENTPSEDERYLLSEEYETPSIKTVRENADSERVFLLNAGSVSPIMLKADETQTTRIVLAAPDAFEDHKPLYLNVERAYDATHQETMFQWKIAAYHGAQEIMDSVTINRLDENINQGENYYLKDAVTNFLKDRLNMDGEAIAKNLRPADDGLFSQMLETFTTNGEEILVPVEDRVHLYTPFEGAEDLVENGSIEYDTSGLEFAWKITYDIPYGTRAGHYEHSQSGLLPYSALISMLGIRDAQIETRNLENSLSETGRDASSQDHSLPESFERGDVFLFHGEAYVVYTAKGNGTSGSFYAVLEEEPKGEDSLYAIHYNGNYRQFLSLDGTFENAHRKSEVYDDQFDEDVSLRPQEGDTIRTPGGTFIVEAVYTGDIFSLKNTDPEAARLRATYIGSIPGPYQTLSRKSWPVYEETKAPDPDIMPAGIFPFDSARAGESFSYNNSTYTLISEDPAGSTKTFRVTHTENGIREGDRFEWNGSLYEVFKTVPSQPYLERSPRGIYAYNLSRNPGQFAIELYGSYEDILKEGNFVFHPFSRTITLKEGSQQAYRIQIANSAQADDMSAPRLYSLRRLTYEYPIPEENGEHKQLRRPEDLIREGDRIYFDGSEKTVIRKRGEYVFLKEDPSDSGEKEQRLSGLPASFAIVNRHSFQFESVFDQVKENISFLENARRGHSASDDNTARQNLSWTEKDISLFNALINLYGKERIPAFISDAEEIAAVPASDSLPAQPRTIQTEPVPTDAAETEAFLFDDIAKGTEFTFRGRIFRYEKANEDGGKEYSFWNTIQTAKSGDRFIYRGSTYEIMDRSGEGGAWAQSGINWTSRIPTGLQAVNISDTAAPFALEIYGDFASVLTSAPGFVFLPMRRSAVYHAPLFQLPEESGVYINETIGSERPLSHLLTYNYHYLRNDATHLSLFDPDEEGTFARFDGRQHHTPSGLAGIINEGDIIRFLAGGRLGNGEKTYLIRKKRGSVLFGSEISPSTGAVSQSIQSIHPLPETLEITHRPAWPAESVREQVTKELAAAERKIYTLQNSEQSKESGAEILRLNENARILRAIYESFPADKDITAIRDGEEENAGAFSKSLMGSIAGNYRIPSDDFQTATPMARARRNIEAIRTLKRIESENRYATGKEQEILARYVGWGGLSACFDDSNELLSESREIRDLLTNEEYAAARESTLTAFYTPPEVIRAIYGTLSRMGFRDGNILEPAMGTGNFFGMLPEEMLTSRLTGIELDSISSRIAKLLYPESDITSGAYEDVSLPDSYFDVAIGNVPFGSFSVADQRYDRHNFPIHEYFLAKTLDKVRPGGIIAVICSRYLLDKKDSYARRYLAQRADLLGAVRLPEETFSGSSGTNVISDILFLKKRDSFSEEEPEWVFSKAPDGQPEGIRYSAYFQNHPEMAIGDFEARIAQWGITPSWRLNGRNLSEELERCLKNIHGSIEPEAAMTLDDMGEEDTSIPADPNQMNFTFSERDGRIYFKENSRMYRVDISGKRQDRVRGMIRIREAMLPLVEAEASGAPDDTVTVLRERLNSVYDDFVERNGHLCETGNRRAFMEDASYCQIASLEDTNEHNEFLRKSEIFTKRTIRPEKAMDHADTAADALTLSLRHTGRVDMEFMTKISSIPEEDLMTALAGRIYKDPESGEYLSSDDYLSGDTRKKLRIAAEKARTDPQYTANEKALEKALPKWVSAADIEVHMGAVWIDPSYYEQFMYEYLDTAKEYQRGGSFSWATITITYDESTATYTVEGKERGNSWSIASYTKGTTRANAYVLMECALNQKLVQIKDPERMDDGRIEYVLNFPATQAAQEKQHEMERAFEDWIFKDRDRRLFLEEKYNNTFNNITPRKYDGSFFDFPGMNPLIDLMDHQRCGVARIVLNHSNTLLGHVVGAGKTFEMIAGCMERKRLGLSSKALFVVPNHLVEQWGQDFYRLYPGCHILVAGQSDFMKNNRRRLFSRMATGDYDAIIIGHSQFLRLPLSKEKESQYIKAEINGLASSIKKYGLRQESTVKRLEKKKKTLETSLKRLINADAKDDVIPFDYLGIDALYVDEAHLFKNLGFDTKKRNVAGVTNNPSQRATDLYLKTKYISEVSGGTGVIFATGTPVSNSMSELYTLMRYLQFPMLKEKGLSQFDAWAAQFGLTVMSFELNTLGTGYRSKERFSRFFNLPELLGMFQESCDVKTKEELDLPGPKAIYHTEETEKSQFQSLIMEDLERRSEAIHTKTVDPREDNMLKVTMDGRRVALDQRIYNPDLPEGDNCKARKCAGNILRLYRETQDEKGAQLVFCDQSVPNTKAPFNVYDELKRILTEGGIPEEEIVFIQDASSDAKKRALFAKVRAGEVRVLIGSTEKMGAGMNVQDRLIALHHLDIPWRPSDIEQREGRIIRQGNMNETVHIYRYITKDTFDAYSWQILESKAKFISQIMNTKNVSRSADDIDENVLSYAEVKALCTGNEDIRRQIMLSAEVSRLKVARNLYKKEQDRLEDNITRAYPNKIKDLKETINLNRKDLALFEKNTTQRDGFVFHFPDGDEHKRTDAGKKIRSLLRENRYSGEAVPIGTYLGFEISGMYAPMQTDAHSSSYLLIAKANATHRYPVFGTGKAVINSLEESFSGIKNQIGLLEKTIEKIEKNLEEEKKLFGIPWKKEEEYQEKVRQLEELNSRLHLNTPDRVQTVYEIEDEAIDAEHRAQTPQEDAPGHYENITGSSEPDTENAMAEDGPDEKVDTPDPLKILKDRGRKFLKEGDIIFYDRTRYIVESATDSGLFLRRFSRPDDYDYKPLSRETISLNHNWVNNEQLKVALVIGQNFTKDDTKQEAFSKFLKQYSEKKTREILNMIEHDGFSGPAIISCRR